MSKREVTEIAADYMKARQEHEWLEALAKEAKAKEFKAAKARFDLYNEITGLVEEGDPVLVVLLEGEDQALVVRHNGVDMLPVLKIEGK